MCKITGFTVPSDNNNTAQVSGNVTVFIKRTDSKEKLSDLSSNSSIKTSNQLVHSAEIDSDIEEGFATSDVSKESISLASPVISSVIKQDSTVSLENTAVKPTKLSSNLHLLVQDLEIAPIQAPKSLHEALKTGYTQTPDRSGGMDIGAQQRALSEANIAIAEKIELPGIRYSVKLASKYTGNDGIEKKVSPNDIFMINQVGKDQFHIYKVENNQPVLDSDGIITGTNKVFTALKREENSIRDTPLFKDGLPEKKDIKQGPIGNCFLIASLDAIMRKNPHDIHNMIKDNKDGTVTVRLFEVNGIGDNKTFKPKFITVNKSLPIDGKHAKGSPWLQMMEKAYALEKGTSVDVEGGRMSDPMEVFLGSRVKDIDINHATDSTNFIRNLFTNPNTLYPAYNFNNQTVDNLIRAMQQDKRFSASDIEIVQRNKEMLVEIAAASPISGETLDTFRNQLSGYMNIDPGSEKGTQLLTLLEDLSQTKDLELLEKFNTYKTMLDNPAITSIIQGEINPVIKKAQDGFGQIRYDEILVPKLNILSTFELPTSAQESVINDINTALKENLPGKRMSGQYSSPQLDLFNLITQKLRDGKHLGLGTNKSVGRRPSSELGFSAGEPISKGLVGRHAFSIIDVKEENKIKYVKISNPWGEINRTYNSRTSKPEKTNDGESWIELSDISKRCNNLSFS